jgi:glucosamine kinase
MITVLGVDAGQSAVRMRQSGRDDAIVVEGVSRLEGDPVDALADAVASAAREGNFGAIERVVIGATTAPADDESKDRLCALIARATGATDVWVTDDAVTSHAGALSLGWGVSLIAGTGVACLAARRDGAAQVFGGHGFLLGDEGGAFWIGRRGLRDVLRAQEGWADNDAGGLTTAAEHRFGSLDGLHVHLHNAERPVNAIAQFAQDVLDVASSGDPLASTILDEAATELVALARAACRWANDDEPVPLALGGRLLVAESPLRRRLHDALARAAVPACSRTADAGGVDGAVLLGLHGIPTQYDKLVHRWHSTVPA